MLSRICKSRFSGSEDLEGIHGITFRRGAHIRLKRVAVDDVNPAREKCRYKVFQSYIVIHVLHDFRCDLNHDVNIAVRSVIATRARTKQGGMSHAPRPQRGLILPKTVEDVLTIHTSLYRK